MKFVMIVMFATIGDIYVFTEPSFETRKECMTYLVENSKTLNLKLMMEYGYQKQIHAVNCMDFNEFTAIVNGEREI